MRPVANFRLSKSTQDRLLDQIPLLIDASPANPGKIEMYSGEQPTSADLPASGRRTLLATLNFSNKSFKKSDLGQIEANPITTGNAVANGTASWARITDGAGAVVADCDVGVSNATILLDDVQLVAGGRVSISGFTIAQPRGGPATQQKAAK